MFNNVMRILRRPAMKSPLPPLDEQFYRSARRIKMTGTIGFAAIADIDIQHIEASIDGHLRVVIELDSDGVVNEQTNAAIRSELSSLNTLCDVRIIARGTCASSAMFIMCGVPEECRYATPGLKVWVDQNYFPREARLAMTPEEAALVNEKFADGKRKYYTMEEAKEKLKLFSTVLDVDWLD